MFYIYALLHVAQEKSIVRIAVQGELAAPGLPGASVGLVSIPVQEALVGELVRWALQDINFTLPTGLRCIRLLRRKLLSKLLY